MTKIDSFKANLINPPPARKSLPTPLLETDRLKQSDNIKSANREDLSHLITKLDVRKISKALHPKFENICSLSRPMWTPRQGSRVWALVAHLSLRIPITQVLSLTTVGSVCQGWEGVSLCGMWPCLTMLRVGWHFWVCHPVPWHRTATHRCHYCLRRGAGEGREGGPLEGQPASCRSQRALIGSQKLLHLPDKE